MSINPYHTHTLTERTSLVWRCIQGTYLYSHARNYIHIYKEHDIVCYKQYLYLSYIYGSQPITLFFHESLTQSSTAAARKFKIIYNFLYSARLLLTGSYVWFCKCYWRTALQMSDVTGQKWKLAHWRFNEGQIHVYVHVGGPRIVWNTDIIILLQLGYTHILGSRAAFTCCCLVM